MKKYGLESQVSYLNGGENLKHIIFNQLAQIKYNFIDPVVFNTVAKEVTTNKLFWNSLHNGELRINDRVLLKDYKISEWIPFTPGQYFTKSGIDHRKKAVEYNYEHDEYYPSGKGEMIKGGLGCVRLNKILFKNSEYYVIGASSNSFFHESIPVVLNTDQYKYAQDACEGKKTYKVEIVGKIVELPNYEVIDKRYGIGTPKVCLVANHIYIKKSVSTKRLITIGIAFSYDTQDNMYWTFRSASLSSKENHFNNSREWLLDYMQRYSENRKVKLLNDFDAKVRWFDNVELPLSDIQRGIMVDENARRAADSYSYEFRLGSTKIYKTNIENISNSKINIKY